jgi:allantoicase
MTSSAFTIASCSAWFHLTTEVGKWKDGRTGKRRNETGHVYVTVPIMTIIIIIIIIITITIRHKLGLD